MLMLIKLCKCGLQDFFKKHGIAVMTIRELFDFIVDPTIDDDSVDSYLEEVISNSYGLMAKLLIFIVTAFDMLQVQQKILARGDVISAEEEIADSVFVQVSVEFILSLSLSP